MGRGRDLRIAKCDWGFSWPPLDPPLHMALDLIITPSWLVFFNRLDLCGTFYSINLDVVGWIGLHLFNDDTRPQGILAVLDVVGGFITRWIDDRVLLVT